MTVDADFVVPIEIDGQPHNVFVLKRPGVDTFMKRMGEIYEVVVFTASLSKVCKQELYIYMDESITVSPFSMQIRYWISLISTMLFGTGYSENLVSNTKALM